MHVAAIHSLLPVAEASASGGAAPVPEWIQLLPAGTFSGLDGRGPYHMKDVAALATKSLQAAGGRLPIDENHQIDTGLKAGAPAPARGWIVDLQARDGALWGRVEWTPTGRTLVEEKAYRGISPSFVCNEKTGEVLQVMRAALTNNPNLSLATLHTAQEPTVDLKKLRAALGLAEDADEAAILAAAETSRTAVATHAQQLAAIGKAAGIETAGTPAADAIVTALQARGAGDDPAKLRETVVSLQAQVTTLEGETKKARATAVVDEAIRAGKPIKALREDYIARHCVDAAQVEKELAALPSLHAGGIGERKPGAAADAAGLVGEEARIVALMGVDPEAFKKAAKAANQEVA
ncbi:hypothetical protein GXW74_15600 [Roseomonas eburnea]|uniref:Uncharacterized protein n=1 Tax=Neoroseomonas eburnea TaxID=1346889 RepID=A0A9X9XDY3_9PROT|nr:phage protease [Neoroseomonas eburnea]MBR0681919.1 hypothetical protein [Neoroseomonas eburnea]